jgi:N-succinyldiaminopimelate aminotransferase
MPRPPGLSSRCELIRASVFEQFRHRLEGSGESYIKLHIGDRDGMLPYEIPIDDAWLRENPYVLQYCNTFGIDSLRQVLREKLAADNGLDLASDEIMVTAGASNALSVSAQAILEPGEEVLVLTPAWPFFFGMVRLAGGRVRELPLYSRLFEESELDIAPLIEAAIGPDTVALYLNTPNNPSGKVLSRVQLEAIAELTRRHELWVISDEAYDGMTFDGREHLSIASLPGMAERCISVFSCSKSFAFAGIRLGFLAAHADMVRACNKLMVHQFYGPNTPGQAMIAGAIATRHQWMPGLREGYEALRDAFLVALELPVPRPEGTYFVFFDSTPYLGGRSYDELVGQCLDAGVSVAPGADFGRDFAHHLRLCFTADTRDRVLEGARRLRLLLRE